MGYDKCLLISILKQDNICFFFTQGVTIYLLQIEIRWTFSYFIFSCLSISKRNSLDFVLPAVCKHLLPDMIVVEFLYDCFVQFLK